MSKHLHLVIVGPTPPPAGGMANQTALLARLLAAEGHQVVVVRSNDDYRPRWAGRIRGLRAVVRLLPYLRNLLRAMEGSDLVNVMANSGWAWHLFAAPAIWIARLRGLPVVVKYCGGGAEAFLRRAAWMVRPALRGTTVLTVPSEFLRVIFGRFGIAALVVPDVIDLSRFAASDTASPPSRGPHLIVTRNLEAIYDIPTALRAFREIRERWPGARLSIAGRGAERSALERLADQLGLGDSVRFVGSLGPEAIAALYASADLMLNASTVDNLPNALLEAAASGVPIVSTDPGGIPYMVEDESTAMLVRCGDATALAGAALRVLSDRQLAARLRRNGLELARRYAWPSVKGPLLGAYAVALRGRSQQTGSA